MKQPNRIDSQPAFLLSATPWRETSLLAELFSRDYGRVAVVARSARKRQSELRGVLVPFVPVNASWYGSQELKTLHRAEWIGGWPQPQGRALFSGLYVNELMLKLTVREDPLPELYDVLARERRRQIFARVASRLLERVDDVAHGRNACGKFLGKRFGIGEAELCAERFERLLVAEVVKREAQAVEQLFGERVGFGMNGRVVQGAFAARDAQKARALGKGGRT